MPNNTRERIEEIKNIIADEVLTKDGQVYLSSTGEERLKTFFHQELQKARQSWLREEIVKLEGMKIKELPSSLDDTTGFVMGHSKNITLQTIIDRYQSELDQPK